MMRKVTRIANIFSEVDRNRLNSKTNDQRDTGVALAGLAASNMDKIINNVGHTMGDHIVGERIKKRREERKKRKKRRKGEKKGNV